MRIYLSAYFKLYLSLYSSSFYSYPTLIHVSLFSIHYVYRHSKHISCTIFCLSFSRYFLLLSRPTQICLLLLLLLLMMLSLLRFLPTTANILALVPYSFNLIPPSRIHRRQSNHHCTLSPPRFYPPPHIDSLRPGTRPFPCQIHPFIHTCTIVI